VKSVAELVALAKAKPGTLTYASSGQGTPVHLAAEMFRVLANIDVVHVPYKDAAPMMKDQIAGLVTFSFSVAPAALPQVAGGRVNALAITSAARSPLVPDLPTMQEAGIKGYEASQWVGFFAPSPRYARVHRN
jgi:tripartite-type tricarboxylate transporter receptor subunit TctC